MVALCCGSALLFMIVLTEVFLFIYTTFGRNEKT